MKTHYDINTALYVIGIKQRWRRTLFLILKRHELNEADLQYGISIDRIAQIIDGLSPLERRVYGIKAKGGRNNG